MKYKNLTPDQKTEAIELATEQWQAEFDGDHVLEDYRTKLNGMGFEDLTFRWDLSYCQGSGASFICSIDLVKFLKFHKATNKYRAAFTAMKMYEGWSPSIVDDIYCPYNHYNSVNLKFDDLDYVEEISKKAADQLENLADWAFEVAQDEMKNLHRALESDYEWSWKTENIVECLESGDFPYIFSLETPKLCLA